MLLSLVIIPSTPSAFSLGQFLYGDVFVCFTLECQLNFWNILGERIKQWSRAEFFHHHLNYHFITRVFHLQNNLIKALEIVFQVLAIFPVDREEVGDILLSDPAAHEIGDKESAQITKRVNGS